MFTQSMAPEARVYCVILLILGVLYVVTGLTRRAEHKAAERAGGQAERQKIDEWAAATRRSIAAAEARAANAERDLAAWQDWYDATKSTVDDVYHSAHRDPTDPDATQLTDKPFGIDATQVMGQPAAGGAE